MHAEQHWQPVVLCRAAAAAMDLRASAGDIELVDDDSDHVPS